MGRPAPGSVRVVSAIVRWGILSTANIGRAAVIPAIHASSNGLAVAVASRDRDRADAFAAANGIARAHGSYEALLEDPDVDALYIPLPNSMHREWTVRAARAGKHVLCEKPLGLDSGECMEMASAADEAGVKLMEAFMYRFHPRTERVADMLRHGVVGPVRTIRSSFTFRLTNPGNIRLSAELGGGSLMDVGCYCVNVMRTMMGLEPVEVHATANWAESGVDEELVGVLRFADGAMGHFDCSLTTERREFYEASGTDGTLVVDDAFLPGTGPVEIVEDRGRREGAVHTVSGVDEYRLMVGHFADCILHDRPVRYPAAEAARNMAVIEALYASARAGGVGVKPAF